jgi:AraC-like DNA-binding protein
MVAGAPDRAWKSGGVRAVSRPSGTRDYVRFRRALTLLHDERERLSGIALSCAYYDQAHFGTEFRAMCGVAPSQYRSALRYPNSVSLAEHGPAAG